MGKFTAYKLPLKSLTEGVHEFEYKLDKQFFVNMDYAEVRDADLAVHLTVNHHRDIYSLAFHIEGTVTLLCDRCLDDLELPVDTDYAVDVEYGEDYNDDTDGLLVIPESDNYLNVAYMLFITAAAAERGAKYLDDCTLYVTLEPCLMCAGAIGWSQLRRIVIGARDPRRGFSSVCQSSPFHPRAEVQWDVLADECRDLVVNFFKQRR